MITCKPEVGADSAGGCCGIVGWMLGWIPGVGYGMDCGGDSKDGF